MKRTLTTLLCLLVALTLTSCVTINVPAKETPTPEPTVTPSPTPTATATPAPTPEVTPEPTSTPMVVVSKEEIVSQVVDLIEDSMDGYSALGDVRDGDCYIIIYGDETLSDYCAMLKDSSTDESKKALAKLFIREVYSFCDTVAEQVPGLLEAAGHTDGDIIVALYPDEDSDPEDCIYMLKNGNVLIKE